MIEIKNRFTRKVIRTIDADTLRMANLSGADLSEADLSVANLSNASLNGADLRGADLTGANLIETNLNGTHLRRAELGDSPPFIIDEGDANLSDANLTDASLGFTTFIGCLTLHKAKGLENIRHVAICSLDAETLRANIEHLPDVFLRGVGYSSEEIETLRGLYGEAFRFYSCFISYARADDEFASRLYSDLQANNVTCWKDTEDMRGGDYWRSQISEAIRLKDKLVVVCSEKSVTKQNVIYEIVKGIELEEKTGVKKLFPIRIDDFILSDELEEMADRETSRGEWPRNWLHKMRAYHVSDFRWWKDHDTYQKAFERLLGDLKSQSGHK